MMHCQCCGRARGVKADGTVPMHHYRNAPCEGTGFPPIEQDDARLAELVDQWAERAESARSTVAVGLYAGANRIEPELVEASVATAAEHKRLARRLQRHRSWPERFRREMERDGYGQPPPEYLWSRK